jgi:hypothetical protein
MIVEGWKSDFPCKKLYCGACSNSFTYPQKFLAVLKSLHNKTHKRLRLFDNNNQVKNTNNTACNNIKLIKQ